MTNYCYILESYYTDHPNLVKILDPNDKMKHNVRTHLCLSVRIGNSFALIPLRKNLGAEIRPYGRIGFAVPSKSKPNAGLDYRYIMIINEEKYLRFDTPRISNKQKRKIEANVDIIEAQAIEYISSFTRAASKGRIDRYARFRESSLINYLAELGVKERMN